MDGLWFAIPVLAAAFLVRRAMPIPRSRRAISTWAFVSFIPYFLWQSLIGGLDVAWRSFHPRLPLEPNSYLYPLRLTSDSSRVFLAQVVSLMPGTLACRISRRNLIVHVLSGSRAALVTELTALENRTAAIFRETLEAGHE